MFFAHRVKAWRTVIAAGYGPLPPAQPSHIGLVRRSHRRQSSIAGTMVDTAAVNKASTSAGRAYFRAAGMVEPAAGQFEHLTGHIAAYAPGKLAPFQPVYGHHADEAADRYPRHRWIPGTQETAGHGPYFSSSSSLSTLLLMTWHDGYV